MDKMNKVEFLVNLWNWQREDTNVLMTPEQAEEDLVFFRKSWDYVPDDLTAEEYMDFWNRNILTTFEMVVVRNASGNPTRVPRWTVMDEFQIAQVIWEANTWGDTDDLVEYVLENYIKEDFDQETDPYAMEKEREAIMDWCAKRV